MNACRSPYRRLDVSKSTGSVSVGKTANIGLVPPDDPLEPVDAPDEVGMPRSTLCRRYPWSSLSDGKSPGSLRDAGPDLSAAVDLARSHFGRMTPASACDAPKSSQAPARIATRSTKAERELHLVAAETL